MYKFYQKKQSESKNIDDPEGVKKEQASYNAAKDLLPNFFDSVEDVVYTPQRDSSCNVVNNENILDINNKNDEETFLKQNVDVPNLINNNREYLGLLINSQPNDKKVSAQKIEFGYNSLKQNLQQQKNINGAYVKKINTCTQNTANRTLGEVEKVSEVYNNNTGLKSALFALKSPLHMAAALTTGPGIYKNHLNLASTAERIARSGDVLDGVNEKDKREQANEHGAVRHALWQAALSSWFFDNVAKDAGDAHEIRPDIDTTQRVFNDLNDADMVVDLLNNKIGRRIGYYNRLMSLKDLALVVLEVFKQNGLYVADNINGNYIVTRRMLNQDKYNELRNLFESMDSWGFQPGEDRTRDNYAPIRLIWEKIKERF